MAGNGRGREGRLVLVADDEDDVRGLVTFRLEHAGYRVAEASDGTEALELARERRPDLCLLDVMMPGLDGYELTRRLRAAPGLDGVPVILLTAAVGEPAVNEGFEAGADGYVRKPFSPEELLGAISRALERRHRRGARLPSSA